ncbi:isochorismatase family protein [Pseudodesulfovibrio tunisiensis]|uniref:isochorismatase family protein n=1 Tax=Pseudodesulfovibrio tunisiensis TaxID=463192 RepID=UPI001FB24B74|nr:isochorismatase family protein [Pseudodesulfovibrio tunisiensis]
MSEPETMLGPGDGVLAVDIQNCFCPGGELPIKDGHEVVPVMNRWFRAAQKAGVPVYLSRDSHPERHPSFREQGGPWPSHAVHDSPGARFHPDLTPPPDADVVIKGTRFDMDQYSAFHETGFAALLARDNVQRLFVGGLALDVCVKETVLDAVSLGFEVHVILKATRPVTPEGGRQAVLEMQRAGAIMEE